MSGNCCKNTPSTSCGSSKPRFILRQLQHFLADKRIVTPGYTSLQDLISNTLLTENQRLGRLISKALTSSDREALQKLLTNLRHWRQRSLQQ